MNQIIAPTRAATLADLLADLGGIAPGRVRARPYPGTATEADLACVPKEPRALLELVDGCLVEKAMGYTESTQALWIAHLLLAFLEKHDLGVLSGADGPIRLGPGLVRLPDVAFVRKERLPGGTMPTAPIPDLVPDLAVEVLSAGNTAAEMDRKIHEYFQAGTALVWLVDCDRRTIAVYTGAEQIRTLTEADILDGGAVLPGFHLPVARVFERLPHAGNAAQ